MPLSLLRYYCGGVRIFFSLPSQQPHSRWNQTASPNPPILYDFNRIHNWAKGCHHCLIHKSNGCWDYWHYSVVSSPPQAIRIIGNRLTAYQPFLNLRHLPLDMERKQIQWRIRRTCWMPAAIRSQWRWIGFSSRFQWQSSMKVFVLITGFRFLMVGKIRSSDRDIAHNLTLLVWFRIIDAANSQFWRGCDAGNICMWKEQNEAFDYLRHPSFPSPPGLEWL